MFSATPVDHTFPRSRVPEEEMTVAQLVKTFSAFVETE
jgi:hypothetical protein